MAILEILYQLFSYKNQLLINVIYVVIASYIIDSRNMDFDNH